MPTPCRPPLDVFCSDCPTHWPRGVIPRFNPRPIDPDAPPPPTNALPGDERASALEIYLDCLTPEQADGLAPSLGWSAALIAGIRPDREPPIEPDPQHRPRECRMTPPSTGSVVRVRYSDPQPGAD